MADWLTRQQVAEYLGVSVRQTFRLDIPRSNLGGRLPRFDRAAIDAWLHERSETPVAARAKGRRPFGPVRRGQDLADFNARLRKALGR